VLALVIHHHLENPNVARLTEALLDTNLSQEPAWEYRALARRCSSCDASFSAGVREPPNRIDEYRTPSNGSSGCA
jgi:hypothetical protein